MENTSHRRHPPRRIACLIALSITALLAITSCARANAEPAVGSQHPCSSISGGAALEAATSSTESHVIGGAAYDLAGRPLRKAHIELSHSGDPSGAQGQIADDKGEFRFDSIPFGAYDVKIQSIGYRPTTVESIVRYGYIDRICVVLQEVAIILDAPQ